YRRQIPFGSFGRVWRRTTRARRSLAPELSNLSFTNYRCNGCCCGAFSTERWLRCCHGNGEGFPGTVYHIPIVFSLYVIATTFARDLVSQLGRREGASRNFSSTTALGILFFASGCQVSPARVSE